MMNDVDRLQTLASATFESLVSLRDLITFPQGHKETEVLITGHPRAKELRAKIRDESTVFWELKRTASSEQIAELHELETGLSAHCLELAPIENSIRGDMAADLVTRLADNVTSLRNVYTPLEFDLAGIVAKDGRSYCSGRWKGTNAVEVLIAIADKAVSTKGQITPSLWLDGLTWEGFERDLKIDLAELRRQPVAPHAHPSGRAPRAHDHCVASMIRTSGGWIIRFQGSAVAFRSLLGMELLFQILQCKGHPADITKQESDAQHLDELNECSDSVQPVLDDDAERSIRKRLKEIEEDLKEANAAGDEDRVRQLESERDGIREILKSARGRSRGMPRTLGSESTKRIARAKSNLKAAMHQLKIDLPQLHDHIRNFTKPLFSEFPCYRPVPDVNWLLTM